MCQWDCGGLRSNPPTDPQRPKLRSTAHRPHCKQCWWCTSPPSKMLDGGPELPRSRMEFVFHGLSEHFPCPSFCLSHHQSCMPLGLPVLIRCFRSPTGQKDPIGLLFQPESIPHCRCPPAGSRIAAATGTNNLATTALVSFLGNGGVEHGPLGLHVPHLARNLFEALPEVGVEALPHRRLHQAFPADPQDSFGSARSNQHPPPPSEPAHHQVVVSGKVRSPLHPSVQDMRLQVR
ncbi:hypothetical protein ILYODFUR_036499 [Ilyodon furcidens]|uniref:Uncharacterized protein n=1 Tax=Ilyodon furcidens TaxID=33524 RepID=A0ABV0T4V8_9TELE